MTLNQIEKILKTKSDRQALKMLCEQKPLGQGIHRIVFPIKGTKKYVLKWQLNPQFRDFSNALEYRNWQDNQYYKKLSKYLAPCYHITPSGRILIQHRTTPATKQQLPKEIPYNLTDTKIQNFGFIGQQFVCHDYPHLLLGNTTMKTAKWWSWRK